MLPLALFSIAIVMGLFAIQNKKGKKSKEYIVECLLRYLLPLSVGVMGIVSFISHSFFTEETAMMIGWAKSPFQYEIASANLAIGIAGLLCIFYRKGFWLATALISSIYLLIDSISYIKYLNIQTPYYGSVGFFLFFEDFFIPLFLLTLALLYARHLSLEK